MMKASDLQNILRKLSDPEKAQTLQRFFKTKPGQYAEGDLFLGIQVPQTRSICRKFSQLPLPQLQVLLKSPYHEDRLAAVLILVDQFEKAQDAKIKKNIVDFYLQNKKSINNWDLVDQSAHKIIGAYCFEIRNKSIMKSLLQSQHHWSRRIAIVSTLYWIRKNHTAPTFQFSSLLLNDKEDLMHKSTGWMLREAGKRNKSKLQSFILKNGNKMPRTMLRYAIEHFPKKQRDLILKSTRLYKK